MLIPIESRAHEAEKSNLLGLEGDDFGWEVTVSPVCTRLFGLLDRPNREESAIIPEPEGGQNEKGDASMCVPQYQARTREDKESRRGSVSRMT